MVRVFSSDEYGPSGKLMLAETFSTVEMSCHEHHACIRELHVLGAVSVGDGRALDWGEIDGGLDAPDGDASQL